MHLFQHGQVEPRLYLEFKSHSYDCDVCHGNRHRAWMASSTSHSASWSSGPARGLSSSFQPRTALGSTWTGLGQRQRTPNLDSTPALEPRTTRPPDSVSHMLFHCRCWAGTKHTRPLPSVPRSCQDRCVHPPACCLVGQASLTSHLVSPTSSRPRTLTHAFSLADNRLH